MPIVCSQFLIDMVYLNISFDIWQVIFIKYKLLLTLNVESQRDNGHNRIFFSWLVPGNCK